MAKETPSIQSFITNLGRQFDDLSSELLTADTLFRDLPGWTSLQSLVVMISFDEEYEVTISAEELQKAKTISDLYGLIKDKQSV